MGDFDQRWEQNVGGRFFVDRECIDCDLCRSTAPANFKRSADGHAFVARQPETTQELAEVQLARAECPVEAIGDREDAER